MRACLIVFSQDLALLGGGCHRGQLHAAAQRLAFLGGWLAALQGHHLPLASSGPLTANSTDLWGGESRAWGYRDQSPALQGFPLTLPWTSSALHKLMAAAEQHQQRTR